MMKLPTAAVAFILFAHLGTASCAEADIHAVNNDDWLHECAQTFQTYAIEGNSYNIARSNHYLISEPSGLCADQLACVFDECRGWEHLGCLLVGPDPATGEVNVTADPASYVDLQGQTFDGAMEGCGIETMSVALPDSISFPKTAADVVAVVEYARDNGMQVSVKSTGHCYTGCHSKVRYNDIFWGEDPLMIESLFCVLLYCNFASSNKHYLQYSLSPIHSRPARS